MATAMYPVSYRGTNGPEPLGFQKEVPVRDLRGPARYADPAFYRPVEERIPMNPQDVFKRVREELPGFGKKVPALPQFPKPNFGVPGFGRGIPFGLIKLAIHLGPVSNAYDVWQLVKPIGYTVNILGAEMLWGPYFYAYPYNAPPDSLSTYSYPGRLAGQYGDARGYYYPMPLTPGSYGVWTTEVDGYQFHAQHSAWYVRPGFSGTELQVFDITTLPMPQPALDPLPAPYPGLSPFPKPVPWVLIPNRVPNPTLSPTEQSQWGYGTGTVLEPTALQVADDTLLHRTTIVVPASGPAVTMPPGFGTVPRDTTHPGVKERKVIITVAAKSLAGIAANIITETNDGLEAIWESIPEAERPGMKYSKKKKKYVRVWNPPPQYKAKWIYDHYDKVNVHDAVENIAKNEVQDSLIGGANKRVTKAWQPWYKRARRFGGFGIGPVM